MKKLLALLAALMILAAPAMAQYTPCPIVGHVYYSDDSPAAGVTITIKNMNTGEIRTAVTGPDGFYLNDWANSIMKYTNGNTFEISIEHYGLSKTVTYSNGADVRADFQLGIVKPCDVCQTCPEPTVCPAPVTCPTCDFNMIDGIIALFVGVAAGTGFQVYTNSKGKKVIKHKHFGVYTATGKTMALHDVNILHPVPLTHPAGELVPKYDNGKYVGG